VANLKLLAVLPLLVGLTGCADLISGRTQDVTIATSPVTGAQCLAKNARGSWATLSTPATVTLLRSNSPLEVSCKTADGMIGTVTVESNFGYPVYGNAANGGLGIAVDTQTGAAYEYPAQILVTLQLPPDLGPRRSVFGADGGTGIAPPIETLAADRARQMDDNVATRFQTLRVLLDEGLITAEEYNNRRGANVGALLRYSMAPPARDLGRAAPPPAQIVARLRYLAAAYAEHSITAGEQAIERATILDNLMPISAIKRADPPPPIKDQLQLAAEIGRIERLLTAHVITSKEAATERAKVGQLLDTAIASEEAAARAAAGTPLTVTSLPNSGVGIALSTLPTEAQAKRIWAGLQKMHPAELGKLKLSLRKVPRPHRPSHYRITAGPLADYSSATALCKMLSKDGTACEATSFGE
jgi:hypothetical protein